MNIAQALKEKNRAAGRVANLQNQLFRYNRYRSDQRPIEDPKVIWANLLKERAHLNQIKYQIQKANAGIAVELVYIAEAKAMLVFLTSNANTAGLRGSTEQVYDRASGNYADSTYTIEYGLDAADLREQVEHYQKMIEDLQDRIDNYNAVTQID